VICVMAFRRGIAGEVQALVQKRRPARGTPAA